MDRSLVGTDSYVAETEPGSVGSRPFIPRAMVALRVTAMSCLILVAVLPAFSQVKITTIEPGEPAESIETVEITMTRAELAQLLYRIYAPDQSLVPDPITAFADLRDFGLIPEHWDESEVVTQRDLAEVLHRLGVQYHPARENGPVSRSFAEAILRRHFGAIREYLGRHINHELDLGDVMDEGSVRPVSPHRF